MPNDFTKRIMTFQTDAIKATPNRRSPEGVQNMTTYISQGIGKSRNRVMPSQLDSSHIFMLGQGQAWISLGVPDYATREKGSLGLRG